MKEISIHINVVTRLFNKLVLMIDLQVVILLVNAYYKQLAIVTTQ